MMGKVAEVMLQPAAKLRGVAIAREGEFFSKKATQALVPSSLQPNIFAVFWTRPSTRSLAYSLPAARLNSPTQSRSSAPHSRPDAIETRQSRLSAWFDKALIPVS